MDCFRWRCCFNRKVFGVDLMPKKNYLLEVLVLVSISIVLSNNLIQFYQAILGIPFTIAVFVFIFSVGFLAPEILKRLK